MLGYSDFVCEVIKRMQKLLGHSYKICVQKLQHNNGIKTDSLVITEEGDSLSECITLKFYYEMYRNKADMDMIVADMLKTYWNARKEKHDIHKSELLDWDFVKGKIMFRIIGTEANRDCLRNMPHRDVCNLSQVFYLMLGTEECFRTLAVNNRLMELWGVGMDDILRHAEKNTLERLPGQFARMDDFLADMSADRTFSTGIPFYVLTNSMKMYGAGCILYDGMLENISGKLGSGFYVLPSSLHEVILIPSRVCEQTVAEQLKQLVIDVNTAEVSEQEILSDSVYYYNKEEKRLSVVL